jgi:hypothetical protein
MENKNKGNASMPPIALNGENTQSRARINDASTLYASKDTQVYKPSKRIRKKFPKKVQEVMWR